MYFLEPLLCTFYLTNTHDSCDVENKQCNTYRNR